MQYEKVDHMFSFLSYQIESKLNSGIIKLEEELTKEEDMVIFVSSHQKESF